MSSALDYIRYSCGIAGEEVAVYVDELERQVSADSDAIDQLRQQLALYEAENSGLRAAGFENGQDLFTSYQGLQKQLAASQLEAKRLRWAIDKWCKFDSLNMDLTEWQGFCAWYQSLPIDDSALREYLAGKVKPLVEALDNFLVENDPSEFGCACDPSVGHVCGPCRTYARQTPLREALEAARKEL